MPVGSGDRWADDYERGRPGWPAEAVALAGLPPSATVLDLGAGTGKLTRVLMPAFRRVVAVEPADPMRRMLAAVCPEAEALAGTAQEVPLADASVDAVFAGEAFHWFHDEHALDEILRVLRPGGSVVLLWNFPAAPWEPSVDDVERLLQEHTPDVDYYPLDLDGPHYTSGEWRQAFEGPRFAPLQEARVANPQTLDREGLVAFFASMGWIGDLPDEERLPLLDEARSLLSAPEYRRAWETHAYRTRTRPSTAAVSQGPSSG